MGSCCPTDTRGDHPRGDYFVVTVKYEYPRVRTEARAGTKTIDGRIVSVFTTEQQRRLRCTEEGYLLGPDGELASPVGTVPMGPVGILDIGTWDVHADSTGIEVLRGQPPSASAARAIIKAHCATPKQFVSLPERDLLGAPAREALMRLADSKHTQGQEDLQVELFLGELEDMVGKEAVASLVAIFDGRVDQVKIRRVEASGERHVINFHTDFSLRTMQVALNGEEGYDGGRLVYATEKGIMQPPRPAGSATIHDNSIPHGVSEMVRGTRYGLFFLMIDPKFAKFGA